MKLNILIVDDENSVIVSYSELLRESLGNNQITISPCVNKEDALNLISENNFDFAIVDAKLPIRHGDSIMLEDNAGKFIMEALYLKNNKIPLLFFSNFRGTITSVTMIEKELPAEYSAIDITAIAKTSLEDLNDRNAVLTEFCKAAEKVCINKIQILKNPYAWGKILVALKKQPINYLTEINCDTTLKDYVVVENDFFKPKNLILPVQALLDKLTCPQTSPWLGKVNGCCRNEIFSYPEIVTEIRETSEEIILDFWEAFKEFKKIEMVDKKKNNLNESVEKVLKAKSAKSLWPPKQFKTNVLKDAKHNLKIRHFFRAIGEISEVIMQKDFRRFDLMVKYLNANNLPSDSTLRVHCNYLGIEYSNTHLNMDNIKDNSFQEENEWVLSFIKNHVW
jgi:hypothetical protein